MDLRRCRKCGQMKPITEFDFRADAKTYRRECKACRRLRQRSRGEPKRRRTEWFVGNTELLRCRACGALKPWTEFPRRGRNSDRLQTWCKACFAAYKAGRHQTNHEREMKRIRRNHDNRVAANRQEVRTYLQTHPCIDCGESDLVVLDFDHVQGTKIADVSALVANGYTWSTIEAEIGKCEVRCANCHRRATDGRRKKSNGLAEDAARYVFGDPEAIRTPDQQLRRLLL